MNHSLGRELAGLPGPILITGHTGFKGTWLTFLLEQLGVGTIGYSLAPQKNCLYDRAQLTGKIPEIYADIRNADTFRKFLVTHKPSAIVHMAAQPLVLESYKTPKETFDTNVMGTVNVLNEAFATDFVQVVIAVTTDKVYRNDNSGRAFVETDPLEGKDPYSASKVGAEAAISAWQQIQEISGGPKVVAVRAGNVIGGGDWAENRLIPDLVRAFISGHSIELRQADSVRPWQHVLDPLLGYLLLLQNILHGNHISSMNFAADKINLSVAEVTAKFETYLGAEVTNLQSRFDLTSKYESQNLTLDSNYAKSLINWESIWSQDESILKTAEWWSDYLRGVENPSTICRKQIHQFLELFSRT